MLLVLLLAVCIARFFVRLSAGSGGVELAVAYLVPVLSVVALSVLVRRDAAALMLYGIAVLSVFGSAIYGGVKDILVRPQCEISAQFDSWVGVGTRWLDVAVAGLVFALVAASRPAAGRVEFARVPATRGFCPAWMSVIMAAGLIYGVWHLVSASFAHLLSESPGFAGTWTTCEQATGAGLTNIALSTNMAVVSGFQEEIVWTGVGLLLLGSASTPKAVAAIAATGGALRALPHMYYTTGAEWYSVIAVTTWATEE